ncbi:archaetidylserine decarboxylase [Candidatus Tachikawaea gelatinosa]|uniref:Phosphatidylserine decarboxylase proenzyme n=1 Tax=Candidatus Tachikawaea gelatinosa TaxID=1410383 RepID=A0A090AIQ7_9ENTR|nr:archaetidylserine decarboxylase [Candidatus Tachikawaea gelatinosa]BAP58293.1 phosphatidylserine decarboxylase proenzyme [Candidatus Tachikawaea gelatinosa]
MLDFLKLKISYLFLNKFIVKFISWLVNIQVTWLTKLFIKLFIWFYKIDMSEVKESNIEKYKNFNDFFARPLKEGMRPIDNDIKSIVFPADGKIFQLGCIKYNILLQAKKKYYTLESLLAGDEKMAEKFYNGKYISIYLHPSNYHRVHMPYTGIIRKIIYVPGEHYLLNTVSINNVKNLYARNERVICYFETEIGPMIQILVGAAMVGSIEILKKGTIIPPREGVIKKWNFSKDHVSNYQNFLLKGQEMGKFKIGSTVISLFSSNNNMRILSHLTVNSLTRVGKPFAVHSYKSK